RGQHRQAARNTSMQTSSETWEVNVAQVKLRAIYEGKLPALIAALAEIENEALSYPQLLDISAHSYGTATIKLLVVGQQTQTWYGEWKDIKARDAAETVRELLQLYREFNLGDGKRHTPFWQCAHKLYKLLNPTGADGFIWSNLIKMDGWTEKGKWGYPGSLVEERINESFNVLTCEVAVAKPDVVVFFTGHSYDECIERSFPGVQFSATPSVGFDTNWLCLIKHDLLPAHSYRTYHPGYLNRQRNGHAVLEAIRALVLDK
ncbi:MAG: hypothetical protein WCC37_07105, partial [Candidatus Sulfotelmatobacter sp.]